MWLINLCFGFLVFKNIKSQQQGINEKLSVLETNYQEFQRKTASTHPSNLRYILQEFPLDKLQFIGCVTQESNQWIIILAPDGKYYQAKKDDWIAQEKIKIEQIDPEEIQLEGKGSIKL